jgi:hypothetical protein
MDTDSTTLGGTYFSFLSNLDLSFGLLFSFHLKHTYLKSKKVENFGLNRGYPHNPHTRPRTYRNHANTLFTPAATGPICPTRRGAGWGQKGRKIASLVLTSIYMY